MPKRVVRHAVVVAGITGVLALIEPAVPRAQPTLAVEPVTSLAPTIHPPVAREVGTMWMAPSEADRVAAASNPALGYLQEALNLYAQEKYELALARFASAATPTSPLRNHAAYYAAVSELRLERFTAARRRFSDLKDAQGFLSEAAALGEAESAQGEGDYGAAVRIYERLLRGTAVDEPAIQLSLATAAVADGDRAKAAEAYLRLYYEYPLSGFAPEAAGPLQTMPEVQPIAAGNMRYKLELGRGERLFGSRRYPEARASFVRVKPHASGDEAEAVALRLAEIDYFARRYQTAREALKPFLNTGARQAEARFYYLMSQRGLRFYSSFELLTRALVGDFPDSPWAEEALNNLATLFIQQDKDDEADLVLREMYARFPRGRYAERAAWKVGWRAYRAGTMVVAAQHFETAAGNFPRSDYRPPYLYWAGRAREAMKDRAGAMSRYQLAVADYQNTYYGRLAARQLADFGTASVGSNLVFVRSVQAMAGEGVHLPPTADTIRTLLAAGLYEPAVKELEFALKKWGDSPAIGATIAWANYQRSAAETGTGQFTLARGAITLMKRSYPQYMAAGGELLPREILTTIFPLSYWDLIQKYAKPPGLDPYLLAALMAQESTFVPDIRSSANAYGLMQLLPSTGRMLAAKLKLPYSQRLLTTAEPNIRMGTQYLADKVREFGSVHLALASYNAGERAVRRWLAERGSSLSREEFIDDIPYPETQNYVKRILGTAEDYRRLYGSQ